MKILSLQLRSIPFWHSVHVQTEHLIFVQKPLLNWNPWKLLGQSRGNSMKTLL